MKRGDGEQKECSLIDLLERTAAGLDQWTNDLRRGKCSQASLIEPSKYEALSYSCRHFDDKDASRIWVWDKCKNYVPSLLFMERHLKIIVVTNFLAAISMGASFMWLSQATGLENPSGLVKWVNSSLSLSDEHLLISISE